MSEFKVKKIKEITADIRVPGDKSISHRSIFLGALSNGPCHITGFLPSEDCLATVKAMRALGVEIDVLDDEDSPTGPGTCLVVHGKKLQLTAPREAIDCGNSGTTMRLICGILSAQPFRTTLIGDASLSKRPMGRVIDPLTKMGANIVAHGDGGAAPLEITGGELKPMDYELPMASAQVKSSILLAGLFAKGKTTVKEPVVTRDHTERMLNYFLVKTLRVKDKVSVYGPQVLESREFYVPGDISSAAFWIVAAAAMPESRLTIEGVGLNSTRTGLLQVLVRMGAHIQEMVIDDAAEPYGNIEVRGTELKGTLISGAEIANVIDELPIIAVAAALAKGKTTIRDAQELRVKETDRINAVATNLRAMGVEVREFHDGMEIEGGAVLKGTRLNSFGDHRIAMAFAIAGLFSEGETVIENTECVATSYPTFMEEMKGVCGG